MTRQNQLRLKCLTNALGSLRYAEEQFLQALDDETYENDEDDWDVRNLYERTCNVINDVEDIVE